EVGQEPVAVKTPFRFAFPAAFLAAFLPALLGVGIVLLPTGRAHAATGPSRLADDGGGAPADGNRASLLSERQKLRAERDRVNAETEALKREPRGVGNEYRLRNRMADAEALAKRLTGIDARLRALGETSAGEAPARGGAAAPPLGATGGAA